MTDSPDSPTPEQVWEAAFDALQSGDETKAQDGFLHWALLLDENAQAAWLNEIPAELHNTIGSILQTANTISASPNDAANTWERLGNTWSTADRPDWAHDCFTRATQIATESAVAHYHLGISYFGMGSIDEAQACFIRATKLDPTHADSRYNLGLCHQTNGNSESAKQEYLKVLELEPGHRYAGNNLASMHMGELNLSQARDCLDSVIKRHPENPPARRNRAQVLLLQGEFQQGWADFEYRFQTGTREQYPGKTPWHGEPIQDKHLLVHFEQGLGDTIMFSRFLPRLREQCGRLTFACQEPLLSLIKNSFPQIDVVAGDESATDFDVHLPLLSLGDRLGLHTKPDFQSGPYLKSDKHAALPDNGKPKVGVAWAGNPNHKSDVSRSIPWEQFKTVVELDGIDFYNLQVGPRASDCGDRLISLKNRIADFSDTAAIVSQLDLVITVDTAVAHLAAALGKPTWILIAALPDWRWMMERDDSPWYPSVTLFRATLQTGWDTTLVELKKRLLRQM